MCVQTGLELELEQAKVQRAALEEELTAKQEQLEGSQAQVGSPAFPPGAGFPKLCSWKVCCSCAAVEEVETQCQAGAAGGFTALGGHSCSMKFCSLRPRRIWRAV